MACIFCPPPQVTWIFTIFFLVLGSSAALFGRRLETLGPRFAACVAALCWGLGYVVAAIGVKHHTLWLIYLGNGGIGGLGLGLGYISPVSTLMKWFPDRRGMATGLAIAGFGGGAVIGSPLSALLMLHYPLWKVFMILGGVYTVAMLVGGLAYRVPPPGWKPHGFQPNTSGTGINKVRWCIQIGLESGLEEEGSFRALQSHEKAGDTEPLCMLLCAMVLGRLCGREPCHSDAALLAAVGDPLCQRVGRHRHHQPALTHRAGKKNTVAVVLPVDGTHLLNQQRVQTKGFSLYIS